MTASSKSVRSTAFVREPATARSPELAERRRARRPALVSLCPRVKNVGILVRIRVTQIVTTKFSVKIGGIQWGFDPKVCMELHTMGDEDLVSKLRNASLSSRRSFLRRSAAAGAGALALAVGSSNTALAHAGTDDDFDDVEVLNFALTLEHLEYAFYRDGLERFETKDFRTARVLRGFSNRIKGDVRSNLEDVRDHEEIHVDTLTSVVTDLGGTPVEEACYDFGYDTVSEFLGVAAVLENTGVSAYDGAISLIEAEDLLTAGATIATVEARHASYLNLLNGDSPFPEAFDEPKTPSQVLDAAGGFIVDCE